MRARRRLDNWRGGLVLSAHAGSQGRASSWMDFDQTPVSCRGYEQHEDDGGDRHEGCTDQRRCTGRTQIVEPLLPIAFVDSEIGGLNGIGSVQLRHFNFMSRPYLTDISPRSGVHDRNPTGTLTALFDTAGSNHLDRDLLQCAIEYVCWRGFPSAWSATPRPRRD